IQFYLANDSNGFGSGVRASANTPGQSALFATNGGVPVINQYDIVIVECEGYPQAESASDLAALKTYAESGGRVFASDFAKVWLSTNGNFAQTANWTPESPEGSRTAYVDLTSNPKGMAFDTWLQTIGLAATGSTMVTQPITPTWRNTNGIVAPTQQWLYWNQGTTAVPM